mmetsp:Transcript_65827/g.174548  ORF Transcript_65827/g.174548 Transcript_65827/m.174548 type:complete len:267 (-) Transcript_65827:350-1150(-)|eukprot:CAMPEP_0194530098 /NCGR_PEP_ID=MMETSP0253-20130528/66949_1 /TAXON_ID=2966 /ORGANISM="Noctiluca scintillans" /LENGTH=266 /DNA_ID=CAMNT_0039375289 /DNA_START=43 /DNA_END=843 /DNA_ORIENTATION=-
MWRAVKSVCSGAAPAAGLRPAFGLQCEPVLLPGGLMAPLQVRWKRAKKRKKREKQEDRPPELKAVSAGTKQSRIENAVFAPDTPYMMSQQIKKHMRGLVSDGRHNVRRKKDLTRYTSYKVHRIAGLTHDNPKEEVPRMGFVTPLTEMQHNANLPRSAQHRRFGFPHTLNYKVYWGPPSVQDEPNLYEGSMVGCNLALRLDDLPLTARQRQRLTDIVGPAHFDEDTGVVALHADTFPERNHNAAFLGDVVEQLLREVMDAEKEVDAE